MTDTWPGFWKSHIEAAMSEWPPTTITPRQTLVGGKSGSPVWLVDVQSDDFNGVAILKIAPGPVAEELARHRAALKDNASFSKEHFPSIIRQSEASRALLMTVAGQGLLFTEQLTDPLPHDRRLLALQNVTDGLLVAWNKSAGFSTEPVAARDVLDRWLGYRLSPESRLVEFIEEVIGGDKEANAFVVDDRILCNPFAIVRSSIFDDPRLRLTPIAGFSHGDLHGGNVLIHRENCSVFYVIDFSFYESSAPLLFDLSYLEVSLVVNWRRGASSPRLRDLVTSLQKVEDSREVATAAKILDDEGLLRTVAHMRSRVHSWINKLYPERKEDLRKQLFLSRVAAGLNFANKVELDEEKASSDRLKMFCFEYAAAYLQALLQFTKVEVNLKPQVPAKVHVPRPNSDAWRVVWEECDSFAEGRNIFILLVGTKIRSIPYDCKTALLRVPWTLVLDFDNAGDEDSLYHLARPLIEERRSFRLLLPGQEVPANFSGTLWFSTNGLLPISGKGYSCFAEWRRSVIESVSRVAKRLARATAPKPVTIVVLGAGAQPERVSRAWESLDNHLLLPRTVIVLDGADDHTEQAVDAAAGGCTTVRVTYTDLALGLAAMYGEERASDTARIPVLNIETGRPETSAVSRTDLAHMSDAFELVHNALADVVEGTQDGEAASDFLHGAPITWRELDRSIDVTRDAYDKLRKDATDALSRGRTVALTLRHSAGAGGSTLARRVAWDMRNTYPVIVLKRWSDLSTDRLSLLAGLTNLPMLVLIEDGVFTSEAQRARLFLDARSKQMRIVTLEVVRSRLRHAGQDTLTLFDPMSKPEARRFRDRYKNLAPATRHAVLDSLALDDAYADIRSPFFFGFYAFEETFIKIADFVDKHLSELTDAQKTLIAFVALASAYSQHGLPAELLLRMSSEWEGRYARLGDLIGEAGKRLVIAGPSVKIAHPRIAEEILHIYLRPSTSGSATAWRAGLPDLCCLFIERVAQAVGGLAEGGAHLGESQPAEDILSQVFIERRSDPGSSRTGTQFSELIMDMPSDQAAGRVLETLCRYFEDNPHFWNHWGRYSNIRLRVPYEESEEIFNTAIDKAALREEEDASHWHGLGMVYRFEIEARLQRARSERAAASDALKSIYDLFQGAEDCFQRARDSNITDEHGYVTHVQIIQEAVENMLRLSGKGTYAELLEDAGPVAEWCRDRVARAEQLLDRLHHIQAEGLPSRYLVECESKLQGLYGNFDRMVSGLSQLLGRDDVYKAPVRRLMCRLYLRRVGGDLEHMRRRVAEKITDMAMRNMMEDPGSRQDALLWLRTARLLPGFTIARAIEQMYILERETQSIEAHYYLYILHFLNSRAGARDSGREARKHIEICKKRGHPFMSKRSFEWFASSRLERPCPLVHHTELGEWDKTTEFFGRADKLGRVDGYVADIKGEQAGTLQVGELQAFFVPGQGQGRFRRGVDNNVAVSAFLGFSYEGPRAWSVVKRVAGQ